MADQSVFNMRDCNLSRHTVMKGASLGPLQGQIISLICAGIPHVAGIYAYGSRVNGPTHPESDLDIALLLSPGESVTIETLAQLEGDLDAVAGCAVEVSVLDRGRSVVHCKEVVSTGVLLFVGDAIAVEAFEMQVFAEYASFCEDRKPVLTAYRMENPGG